MAPVSDTNIMRIILKTMIAFLVLPGAVRLLEAQDKPSDFVHQLPEIFTAVCTASNAEAQAYGEKLGAFTKTVESKLESLAALKKKSQAGMKINPNANTSELERQLEKTRKTISNTEYSEKFYQALHDDAEKIMKQRTDEIHKRAAASSDYREILKSLDEIKQVRREYCKASSPHYIGLLVEQRAALERDVTAIVTADDLSQQINCKTLGFIYYPELSYETAYIRILDHLNSVFLLLGFCPGNE